jgi:serine phosphatase RsbU (regulator of sigma subunit)
MALARDVQRAMIPPEEVISHGPLRVLGFCESASVCGGDFWTLRKLPGDRLLVVVGDVTGHGMSSAMIAAAARGAVEALTISAERMLTPEEVLGAMDRAVRSVAQQQLLMTAFAALIDARRGSIDFANAGHNFPYLVSHDAGTGDLSDVHVLAVRGNPLGASDPLIQTGHRELAPGDILIAFTDGVVDRVDGEGKRFGDRRLQRCLRDRPGVAREDGLAGLRNEILLRLRNFAGTTPLDDDITLVLCQYNPPAAAVLPRKAAS